MKEIVILSGKGGTGKTSVAAALAVLAGKEAVIADCDVDAANMHLMLKPDFAKASDFYGGLVASINNDSCIGCGKCFDVCRFDAVIKTQDSFTINKLDCEGCGYCEKVCPSASVLMQKRYSGVLYISSIRTGTSMVHAKLGIGAENSGKLVAEVKKKATEIAFTSGKKYVIADGSPGIGCPVVSSLSGASYVLLVTEPTLSASHDLKRLIELIKAFNIPSGCIINKYDINPKQTAAILKFLYEEKIEHLCNIPFNNKVAGEMSKSVTMAEGNGIIKAKIIDLWKKLKLKTEII